jgi:hypothetical protein
MMGYPTAFRYFFSDIYIAGHIDRQLLKQHSSPAHNNNAGQQAQAQAYFFGGGTHVRVMSFTSLIATGVTLID